MNEDAGPLGDQYLTTREAATMLRVTPRTIRRMVTAGRLIAYRRGPNGGLLISARSMGALLENSEWHRARRRAEVGA